MIIGQRKSGAFKATLSGAALNTTVEPSPRWWNFIGYKIKFSAVYTGTITVTCVVNDTTNETNWVYNTPTLTAITRYDIYGQSEPLFMARAGDTLKFETSAAFTGTINITYFYEVGTSPE